MRCRGRAEINRDKILPHQAGEFDGGRAVRLHDGVGAQPHDDLDLAVGVVGLDVLDAPDFDAGHFDGVADLQFLRGVEQRVDVVAAVKYVHVAERFNDEHGDNDREGDKNAELGFE